MTKPYTNVGLNVTDEERRLKDQEAANVEKVERRIAKTGTDGSDKHAVVLDKTAPLSVTTDQLADTGFGDYRPVIPIASELRPDGGIDHILKPSDYAHVRDGKVCAKCLEWQTEVFTPHCNWRGKDGGCGHVRNLELDMAYLQMKGNE